MKHTKCVVVRKVRGFEETCIMDLGPGPFSITINGTNVNIGLQEVLSLTIENAGEVETEEECEHEFRGHTASGYLCHKCGAIK